MALDIVVCIKAVTHGGRHSAGMGPGSDLGLNRYDRCAVQVAVDQVAKDGGSVTLVSMGPKSAETALYEGLALGADRAVLVSDPLFRESDTLITSRVLCRAVTTLNQLDLLMFGTRSSDSDTGQVGPQSAQMLSLPFVSHAHEFSYKDGEFHVSRRADGFLETFRLKPPAALSVVSHDEMIRHTGLGPIAQAFSEPPITVLNHEDLGLAADTVGKIASPTCMLQKEPLKKKGRCRFLDGSMADNARNLADILIRDGLMP